VKKQPGDTRTRRVFAFLPRRVAGRWLWLRRHTVVERWEYVDYDYFQEHDRYEWEVIERRWD
jgi:hypothetical protein